MRNGRPSRAKRLLVIAATVALWIVTVFAAVASLVVLVKLVQLMVATGAPPIP